MRGELGAEESSSRQARAAEDVQRSLVRVRRGVIAGTGTGAGPTVIATGAAGVCQTVWVWRTPAVHARSGPAWLRGGQ